MEVQDHTKYVANGCPEHDIGTLKSETYLVIKMK